MLDHGLHRPQIESITDCRMCVAIVDLMPQLRVKEAAELLNVSDDTVRRLVEAGRLAATTDDAGRQVIEGGDLADYLRHRAEPQSGLLRSSARNRFRGLVTEIRMDAVMAQVELACGPHRVVSLMSSEAVRDLGLEIGSVATAVVKSTNVIVETP